MTRMNARYAGTCAVCGRSIRLGTDIDYDRATRQARHFSCQPYQREKDDILVSQGEGYGGRPYTVGQVMHQAAAESCPEVRFAGWPDRFLVVKHATSQYYREDGTTFGVGDESGYLYIAYCRPATEAESAPLRGQESAARAHREASGRLAELARQAQATGERPAGDDGGDWPQGERILEAFNIYGGGDCWIITADAIWYVRGNGGDGDNWANNNLRGAIGWRLAYDETLAAELRQLAGALGVNA